MKAAFWSVAIVDAALTFAVFVEWVARKITDLPPLLPPTLPPPEPPRRWVTDRDGNHVEQSWDEEQS